MTPNTPIDRVLKPLHGKRPRTLLRCNCGSHIEMRDTKGYIPMNKAYCPREKKFLQMKHLRFPERKDWPDYGVVIDILLQLDREQARGIH